MNAGDLRVRLESARMQTDWTTRWVGLVKLVEKKMRETQSEDMRHHYLRFFSSTPCDECQGTRLNPVARSVRVDGRSLPELLRLPVGDAHAFFAGLDLGGARGQIAAEVVREVRARLRLPVSVGVATNKLVSQAAIRVGREVEGGLAGSPW